jgi:hypothetical protein
MGLWRWFRGLLSARRERKRAEQAERYFEPDQMRLPETQPVVPSQALRQLRPYPGRESLLDSNGETADPVAPSKLLISARLMAGLFFHDRCARIGGEAERCLGWAFSMISCR